MPPKSKSERSLRSRSRGRSRSRSRGRSKSPSRTKQTKQSPSPSRQSRSASKPVKQKVAKSPPTRQSARIKDIVEKQESVHEEQDEETITTIKTTTTTTTVVTSSDTDSKPSKHQYTFGGPIWTFIMMLLSPAMILGVIVACDKRSCSLDKLPSFPKKLSAYFDRESDLIFFGFVLFQAVLALLPIGKVVRGQSKNHIKAQNYRCNGLASLVISYAVLTVLTYRGYPVTMVYDKFFQLGVISMAFAVLVAIFLFIKSRGVANKDKSPEGNTGCLSHDFFMGRELNPRVGPLHIKLFLMRVGMISWNMINAVLVWKAYSTETLTPALAAVAVFQSLYVVDHFVFEESMLTTLEVNHEGTGFMVASGYMSIPFISCIQAKYLLEHPRHWHPVCIAGFVVLYMIGYIISRGSNSEKDRFRRDPHNPAFANFNKIPTSSGKKLLASGWWGLCRHPNYLGETIMFLAWTFPCGFTHFLPFFWTVLVTFLLMHRAGRDDAICRKKYGSAWDRYCREVKYQLVPYIY